MALSINYPDKVLAGVHQSYTVTSDEGAPSGRVVLAGRELPFRLVRLGAPKTAEVSTTPEVKYKITFLLPDDAAGKSVQLQFAAGSSKVDDSRDIIAE